MTRLLICFSGDRYHPHTQKIVEDSPKFGVDRVLVYDDWWLINKRPDFVKQNEWIFTHDSPYPKSVTGKTHRGFGWFAFKPFIILDALARCADGDIVLYTDADTYPIADLSPLYRICTEQGGQMMFAAQGCKHREFCKRDCFIVMGQDKPEFNGTDVQAGVARFMLFQKGPWVPKQFLMEWLAYCVNPFANTFDPSVLAPEYPELREHRCEQAIMTNLAHKYGWKLWREACEFGNWAMTPSDPYPQLFIQNGAHIYGPQREAGSMWRNIND